LACNPAGVPNPSWCPCHRSWNGATTGIPHRAARKKNSIRIFCRRATGY